MNVKIQGGGGGTYANTGSCTGVVTYLQHEDLERIRQGQQAEPFFNQYRDFVSPKEVTYKIDHNRAQLHKTDAKFFVITVSPSEKELAAMGASPEEQARAMKEYIRKDIIPAYAENFNKGLQADNIEYYANPLYPDGRKAERYARTYHREPARPGEQAQTKLQDQPQGNGERGCKGRF